MAPYVHGRVLEWGCRHAPDCAILSHRGAGSEYHGADLYCGDLFMPFHAASGLRYTQLRDPVALPYADQQFDTVIAHGVLEHVADPEGSLGELHRVLRTGGKLIIDALPHRYSYTEAWLRARHGPAHDRRYAAAPTTRLLHTHGFAVLELKKVGSLPAMLNLAPPYARRAYAHLGRAIDRVDHRLEHTPIAAVAASLFIVAAAQ
jgi:SAM-dependent methyltransferase